MTDPLAPSDPPSAAMPAAGPASAGEAGDAEALFQIEVEGVHGALEPHPGNDGGKRLLLHT